MLAGGPSYIKERDGSSSDERGRGLSWTYEGLVFLRAFLPQTFLDGLAA
jgi:hypothetical protein